jgi:hypothetical protein
MGPASALKTREGCVYGIRSAHGHEGHIAVVTRGLEPLLRLPEWRHIVIDISISKYYGHEGSPGRHVGLTQCGVYLR